MRSFIIVSVLLMLAFAPSFAGIINVPADQSTVQAGIDAAVNGDTVLVADGTYTENINFMGKAVTVASHFLMDGNSDHVDNTIIDGSNPSNADSGSVVLFISGEDTNSVIYGFTLTGGTGTIIEYIYEGSTYQARAGGGVICLNSGARISNNKITNNDVPQYIESSGGGVAGYSAISTDHVIIESNQIVNNTVTGTYSYGSAITLDFNGTIINNHISDNASNATDDAWGALECWSGPSSPSIVTIQNNYISHNKCTGDHAFGGGVSLEGGMSGLILDNEINHDTLTASLQGRGGGIYINQVAQEVTISRNRISYNIVNGSAGKSGGGIYLLGGSTNGNVSVVNNLINGNFSGSGGGIYSSQGELQIINNTIVNNTALSSGGGLSEIGTNPPVVVNTIIWGNQAGIHPQINGTPVVTYSDIEGGHPGTGNIDADPQFQDTIAYLLSSGSACIDSGNPAIFDPEDPLNPGFALFPAMGTLHSDMGAYGGPESSPINGISVDKLVGGVIPQGFTLFQNYPNPFNPTTNIEFLIPKSEFVTLKVYNVLGEEVATLISEPLTPGKYRFAWDASGLASGVYLYRIQAGDYVEAKKMILLR